MGDLQMGRVKVVMVVRDLQTSTRVAVVVVVEDLRMGRVEMVVVAVAVVKVAVVA